MRTAETYSPAEVSAVTGASVRAVRKAMGERLPRGLSVRRDRQRRLTRWGAVCFAIDRKMPKDVPVTVRRQLYATILERQSCARVQHDRGILSYVVDVKAVADRVDARLAQYRDAMGLVVEDAAIQGGAATFRGTRILVHQVADLLAQGADEAELRGDYPRLTPAMLAAAAVYARAHPKRGRPKALECAPARGQAGRFELTSLAGLPENGSHDEASIPWRSVQAASGRGIHRGRNAARPVAATRRLTPTDPDLGWLVRGGCPG